MILGGEGAIRQIAGRGALNFLSRMAPQLAACAIGHFLYCLVDKRAPTAPRITPHALDRPPEYPSVCRC